MKNYRVCRVRCLCCGDVLEHVNHSKEPLSNRMVTCSCGKVQLDPHVCTYRIIGFPSDYEDLSEVWKENTMTREEAKAVIETLINSGILDEHVEQSLVEIADHICKDDWEPCIGTVYCEDCSNRKEQANG